MANPIQFHDYTIQSVLVEAVSRRLVVRAFDSYADRPVFSVAEFTGLAGYHFAGDVLGTIVFDIEECDPSDLYHRFAADLQATYKSTGGHDPWVATFDDARAFIDANELRGFELSSSIGATAAIWCRGFRAWAEDGHAQEGPE